MRQYQNRKLPPVRRYYLTEFGGYHHRPAIDSGECYDMENLTSDDFPLLSVRKARYAYADLDGSSMQNCIALHSRSDHPVVCNDFGQILCHGYALDSLLITENGTVPAALLPKKIVSMGAWCIIFPDKVWFNAVRLANGDTMTAGEDYGSLENETRVKKGTAGYVGGETAVFTSVYYDGTGYLPFDAESITYGAEPPSAPAHGDHWCDTAEPTARLRVYDAASESWAPVLSSYIRITATDAEGQPKPVGRGFSAGDGIEIGGLDGRNVQAEETDPVRNRVQMLNGAHILADCSDTALIIEGCLGAASVSAVNASIDEDIVFARKVPQMDHIVECDNRLWGCRYGLTDGERVNEIYACKLGDFKNWNCFSGISTDSYAASRGAEGEFTGAAVLNGTPLFFREQSFEKVYPSASGAHRIVTVDRPGIQCGSGQSAAVIDGVLYYKGADGVYAYTGSVPRRISDKLGDTEYFDAVAGHCGKKYYISMRDAEGQYGLFVYDTARKLWHREDCTRFCFTAEHRGCLYFEDGGDHAQRIGGVAVCTNVPWMAESGIIGLITPNRKRIGRLTLRLAPEPGTQFRVSVQYDSDGQWHEKVRICGDGLNTVTVPIVPVRCDHLRLRLEGIGGMRLYSVAYTLEQGSDLP